MGLSSHLNVWNTCLHILRARGYALRVQGELLPDGCYPADARWIAEKDGFYFSADNPIELMGLIALYDHIQPTEDLQHWWRIDCGDLYSELMERRFNNPNSRG